MRRRLRAGVIGAGSWSARAHIPALRTDPDVELVVLSRPEEELGQAMAQRHGFARFEPDWRDALEQDLDVVVVSSPPVAHPAQVCASLEAGAHVLCEKPFALCLEDAEVMIETAARMDRALLAGFGWNRHPAFTELRRSIAHDIQHPEFTVARLEVGIRELYTGELPEFMRAGDASPDLATYTDAAVSGGGALWGSGCHLLAMMLWICGRDVRGVHGQAYHAEKSALDLHHSVTVDYVDGSSVTLVMISVPAAQGRVTWEWRSYGAAGSVWLGGVSVPVIFTDREGRRSERRLDVEDGVEALEPTRSLLRVARGGATYPELSGGLATDVVALTDAIQRSWREGGAVVPAMPERA